MDNTDWKETMKTKAWNLGHDAFNDGVHKLDNPYYPAQPEHDEWRAGWQTAADAFERESDD